MDRKAQSARVLVVAAHPDDEILGVGGTVRKHVLSGDDVRIWIACEGISTRYEEEERERLRGHSLLAAKVLGVKEILFGDLPDQRLDTLPLRDVIGKVEEQVRSFRPDTVYTHFGGDVNHDHCVLFRTVQVAIRPYAAPWVREVLVFETPSSTWWGSPPVQGHFVPEVFVDISTTLDTKIEAFCCYEREIRQAPHPRSPEALRARSQHWGSIAGVTAAEPFQVIRSLR